MKDKTIEIKVVIDKERCKGCELCINACPLKLLVMSDDLNIAGYHYALMTDDEKCSSCALCGTVCPDVAITIYK
ncbi:MAG: ferredoxin family protein [bacterium]